MNHRNVLAAATLLLMAAAASAQDAPTPQIESTPQAEPGMTAKKAYEVSRNTRGAVEYCIDKGYLGPESRQHAQLLVTLMEAIAPEGHAGDAVEQQGREGKVVVEGVAQPLSSAPMGEEQWCRQAGVGLKEGAAQFGG